MYKLRQEGSGQLRYGFFWIKMLTDDGKLHRPRGKTEVNLLSYNQKVCSFVSWPS